MTFVNKIKNTIKFLFGKNDKSDVTDLYTIDYLIFSSHKTATQSIKKTLNKNDIRCIHAHELITSD